MEQAMFWEKASDGKIECRLCPHHCRIAEGKRGICGIREARAGKLYAAGYGLISSANSDPIEKKPLFFAEERREASLGMVQNVIANLPGPLAYLFNFGHVEIYTAAEIGRFDFMFVSNPREVQAEIFRRIEAYRTREAQRQARQRQTDMAEWFEAYHRLTAGRS